jgi:hypothetical protein
VADEARETAGGISLTLGVILGLVGLPFFGGFARGRWY